MNTHTQSEGMERRPLVHPDTMVNEMSRAAATSSRVDPVASMADEKTSAASGMADFLTGLCACTVPVFAIGSSLRAAACAASSAIWMTPRLGGGAAVRSPEENRRLLSRKTLMRPLSPANG